MAKAISVRQQLYKKNILSGMSKYAAARAAGYSHNTAKSAKDNLEKHGSLNFWLEVNGITDKALAEHAKEGLQAKKTISAIGDADGKSTDFVEVEDWPTRHKYFESVAKIKGSLKQEGMIDLSKHQHITVVLDGSVQTQQETNGVLDRH